MWQAVKNLILSYLSLCFHKFLKVFIKFALLTTFRVYGSIFWRNSNKHFLMKLSLIEKFVLLLLPWVEFSFNLSVPSKFSQNDWIYILFELIKKISWLLRVNFYFFYNHKLDVLSKSASSFPCVIVLLSKHERKEIAFFFHRTIDYCLLKNYFLVLFP